MISEASVDENKRRSLCNTIAVVALAFSFIVLLFNRFVFWICHPLLVWTDQSVYLEIAQLILQGKVPYVDVFDFNPPLIMYLNVIPVMVSKILRIPAALGLSSTIMLLNALSCAFSAWLVFKNRQVTSAIVLYSLIFMFALYTQGLDTDMGQREHIFLLLYLPYFIGRGLIWMDGKTSLAESIFIGLLAGIGLALKPQFVLLAALSELGFFIQFKKPALFLRPENYAIISVFIIYALCFFLLPPEARNNFFYQIVPVYSWGNLWSAKCLIYMICSASFGMQPFINFISAILLALPLRRRSAWILPLAIFTCGGFFIYFQGGQSWTYRLLPMAFGSYMLYGVELGLVLQYVLQRFDNLLFVRVFLAFGLLAGLCYSSLVAALGVLAEGQGTDRFDLTALDLGYFGTNPRGYLSPIFFCIVEHTKPSDYVLHIGTPIEPGFPAILQSGRRSASRYLYCFIVWLEYAREKSGKEAFEKLEDLVIANYGKDIQKNKPVLIMVQDMPMEYILARYDFFEKYMQGYTMIGKTAEHTIYKLTGNERVFAGSEMAKRQKLVISILAGQKTVEEVATENNWQVKLVQGWVNKARRGVVESVTEAVADKKQELYDENRRLNERINQLNQDAIDLRLQIENLQKSKSNDSEKNGGPGKVR